jgi:hypothetical protein
MEPGSKTRPPIVSCGVQNPAYKGVDRGRAVYWYCIKPRIGGSGCICTPDIKDMFVLLAWQGLKFLYFDIETCSINKGPIIPPSQIHGARFNISGVKQLLKSQKFTRQICIVLLGPCKGVTCFFSHFRSLSRSQRSTVNGSQKTPSNRKRLLTYVRASIGKLLTNAQGSTEGLIFASLQATCTWQFWFTLK